MDNVIIEIVTIIAIGVAVFTISRLSRRSYKGKHGKSSSKDKLRFATIFIIMLVVMLLVVIYYPVAAGFLIAAVILCGYLGILGTKPGTYKDVMYSATICSFITGFTGLLVHGM
jgi:uncharacterized membrane protein YjgN (DUF898 family)